MIESDSFVVMTVFVDKGFVANTYLLRQEGEHVCLAVLITPFFFNSFLDR